VIYTKLLYGLLIAKALQGGKGKVKPKKVVKTIKKESKFLIKLVGEIYKHYK